MGNFTRISPQQAQQLISAGGITLADVRDQLSFQAAHIPGAVHLDNDSLEQFIASSDPQQPVLVYCFHGHSSQNAADFLAGQGFDTVYSLDGGFEQWRQLYPELVSNQPA